MHNLQFIQIYSLIKRFIFISLSLLICFSSQAFAEPKITHFNLIDTDATTYTNRNIVQSLRDGDEIILPIAPKNLSIQAVTNGETQSVEMYIGQAKTSTENHEPYALKGDSNGKYAPVPELRIPGTIFISADPFSQDNASGEKGLRKTISVRIIQPDFIVNNDKDISDSKAGDGVCDTPKVSDYLPPLRLGNNSDNTNLISEKLGSIAETTDVNRIDFIPLLRSCTLRAAIEEANALPGSQTILLPRPKYDYTDPDFIEDHTYKLTKNKELEITDSVTILGYGKPTIDANKQSSVFLIHRKQASNSVASIQSSNNLDLSVVNINDPSNAEVTDQLWENAQEAAENIKLGFPLEHDTPIEKITAELNNLDITQGGGQSNVSTLYGGAIAILGNKVHAVIKRSSIRDSISNNGGGIAILSGASLLLLNSKVHNNIGGFHLQRDSFTARGLQQNGGGISVVGKETEVIIRNSKIFDNKAGRGGGIFNVSSNLDIENSLIIGNNAQDIGGGIVNNSGNLRIAFSTISNNKVSYGKNGKQSKKGLGGGIYTYKGMVSMGSSVVAKNTDEHKSSDCYTTPGSVITGYRHIVVGVLTSDCNMEDHVYNDLTGVNAGNFNNPLNPSFTGGRDTSSENYYVPEDTSILFDNGERSFTIGYTFFSCPNYDYSYTERPQGAACDIGAVEAGVYN